MFPTLSAYEIDGMVLGRLKIRETRHCDIDRNKDRAAVIPFAQKEMVDRFLYGLDDQMDPSKNLPEFHREVQHPRADMISAWLSRPEGVLPCHRIHTFPVTKERRLPF